MTTELTISDVQGMEALRQRLHDPVLFRAAMNEVMAQARRQGLMEARSALDAGTGSAVRTLFGSYSPMQARIWTVMPMRTASMIEQGRAPGNAPSQRALIRWARAVGHPAAANRRELMRLWWEIESRGTKGRHYMAAARQRILDRLPVWLQRAGDRIVKRLAGKAT